jgi:hypothetical protein
VRSILSVLGAAAVLALFACEQPANAVTGPDVDSGSTQLDLTLTGKRKGPDPRLAQEAEEINDQMASIMEGVNEKLSQNGAGYRVVVAEWITEDMMGRTTEFRDRGNKQIDAHFVPRDPRRAWSNPGQPGDDITFAIDQTLDAVPFGGGLTAAETDAAIVRAMDTWDAVKCSDLSLTRNPDFGIDIGVAAFEFSLGAVGSPFIFADVQHAGFRDLDFLGLVLGMTLTYAFESGGEFTDIDGNGKLDVAFREIYYDPSWIWQIDDDIDVETIALHEMGHGLSQGHFGELFQTDRNGKYHWAPFALLNAGYVGVQQGLTGTDLGGHCSIWGSWPNN